MNSDYFLAVYVAENESLVNERLKSLARDILTLLAPGKGDKFFIDPLRGFIFGRDIQQFVAPTSIIQSNMSPSSAIQLQRIHQLFRSPSTKRTSSTTTSTPRSTRVKLTTSTMAMANMMIYLMLALLRQI